MTHRTFANSRSLALTALIVFQIACAAFFVVDAVDDVAEADGFVGIAMHLKVELLVSAALAAGIFVEVLMLSRMLAAARQSERAMGIAQGALADLIEGYFRDWALTPAEADVAGFTLKGCSIAEIAALRGSAEGTVKTHLNAIYRKAGVGGRGQLVSLLIEDLMRNPLVAPMESKASNTQRGA